MPVHKVKGGYKWGHTGKTYPTKEQAEKQARAIYANGWRGDRQGPELAFPLAETSYSDLAGRPVK